MEFSKVQNRFINGKVSGYQLLRGQVGTGKSIAAIYKAINLENNFCMYDDDKVIIITSNINDTYKATEIYDREKIEEHFYSLFSLDNDRVEIKNIKELINIYSKAYKRNKGKTFFKIDKKQALSIVERVFLDKNKSWKKSKFMINASYEFLLEEINWIKSCVFTKEEYLNIDRKGRDKRIKKNSLTREYIYEMVQLYNVEIANNKLMDCYDEVIFAIEYSRNINKKYSHIILDDCESLTRGEIEFVKSIYDKKNYSSLIVIVNNEISNRENVWLVKGRKVNTIDEDIKWKSFLFKNIFENDEKKNNLFMNEFKYIDLKHKSIFQFKKENISMEKEIFVEENGSFKGDSLIELPVYSDIAAGEPILMSGYLEETVYLPKVWVGKAKDNFILSVKGDSMIDKGIDDGDLVVIRKQNTAYHNDIVAVDLDGSATLKTLSLNKKLPLLIPANPKYSPIRLEDKEVNILGVAIGVIKNKR